MGKIFLTYRRLKWFEVGKTKIYGVNMATMALTERGTQFTILVVFAIEVDNRNLLGIISWVCTIATGHYVKCQKVDG